ncbi:MAG: FxLYD domain-containing protein [Candidatus Omnitrophica bacterium]|nr:FxLYD domain-containing protein [Candidatus Omnitrophota bacterium]MBU1923068.1 FxLYD domain-containing protein [Candidatus Omnitrophota bacterium]
MPNFSYYHIEIGKSDNTKEVVVKGEVTNNSDKSYTTVAVRIILFKKNVTVANMVFTVHGLPAGTTKAFKKTIEELEYEQVGKDISRYDIYTETAF